MKVFFRGYNKTASIMSHTDLIDCFTNFECHKISDINITYSLHLLLSENKVYLADCCSKMCEKCFQLPVTEDIIKISSTNNHIVLLCSNGKLLKVKINEKLESDITALPVLLHNNENGDKIVNITCGSKINVAISKEGKIFNIPIELNFKHKGIINVVVGKEHCVLLDTEGKVFTFGSGR